MRALGIALLTAAALTFKSTPILAGSSSPGTIFSVPQCLVPTPGQDLLVGLGGGCLLAAGPYPG
jgi:hypothetical protein